MLENHAPIATEIAPPVSPFDDPECRYVAMPENMRTFVPPSLQDWRLNPRGTEVLSQLAASLANGEPAIIDLHGDVAETREFISEILGEGEISILADKPDERLNITEAVFAGVWRIRRLNNNQPVQDYLETGAFPRVLLEWSASQESPPGLPEAFPENLMNAPALLYELFAKSRDFVPGSEEVINLSLFPLTPEDMEFLIGSMGLAGLSILSRGYGDCRIRRTGFPHVWWVQYFNSTGQLILNTLEITDLPKVVMAAPEDLKDSADRLGEVLAELGKAA